MQIAFVAVECAPVLINDTNNFNNYTGSNIYGTMFYFTCQSGYYLSKGLRSYAEVYCDSAGQWVVPDNPDFDFKCRGKLIHLCKHSKIISNGKKL